MLDIKWIRENPERLDAALATRGAAPQSKTILELDAWRRSAVGEAQAAQERANAVAKEIGEAMRAGDRDRADTLKAEALAIKEGMPRLTSQVLNCEVSMTALLGGVPNLPATDVPVGVDEHDNRLDRVRGERFRTGDAKRPAFPGPYRQHYELGEALGGMDFEAAARMSGARFNVLRGDLARLSRALGQFMLDTHVDMHGYVEVEPPLLVRDEAMFGTAQLPKFADDQFRAGHDRWLIPTGEVPLTNLVREQILPEAELPLRFVALTPCFRAEAGAAGRDVRGLIRQHQFQKVELVSITAPEASEEEHYRMLGCAESVLEMLELPYRVVTLCTGDMGFSARKTFDIEVWLPGQDAYREISSCSNCGDFQARRMDARYRPRDGSGPAFVHTLNGSGTAVGRALVAVMENYQNADGTITVPEVLRHYMGGKALIGLKA